MTDREENNMADGQGVQRVLSRGPVMAAERKAVEWLVEVIKMTGAKWWGTAAAD